MKELRLKNVHTRYSIPGDQFWYIVGLVWLFGALCGMVLAIATKL